MTPTYRADWPFLAGLGLVGGTYVALVAALVAADALATPSASVFAALADPAVAFAVRLTLATSLVSAALAVVVAVPLGYLLARVPFPGRGVVEFLADVPIVLPPLVIGVSLLLLFRWPPLRWLDEQLPVTFAVPGVVLAQFAAVTAYAVRTMKVTFAELSPRPEQVALTLGCTRAQAFWRVALPEARRGVLAAATLAWARALGEFGPVLVFAGATPGKTVVLTTAVYLELSVGRVEAALAVSLLMVLTAAAVLGLTRLAGLRAAAL